MDIKEFLTTCSDIRVYTGLSSQEAKQAERLGLPKEHVEFLTMSNGLEFFGGYYRLFGVADDRRFNLVNWNRPETWKDTWGKVAEKYYFFGMSAIGDSFAYIVGEDGLLTETIVYLDGTTMDVIDSYPDFSSFFQLEIMNRYQGIMEEILVAARKKFGDLDLETGLIYSPSLFLSEQNTAEQLMPMPTMDMMTVNGDLYRQLLDTTEAVHALEPYVDERGRARVKVIFAD